MSKIKHSLSKKLSLTILLMAAPIFVLALGALFLQSRYFIRQEATERANSLLNTTMQRLRNYMSTIETSTNANTWLIEENFYPDSLLVYSNRIVRLNRNVRSCSICAEPDMFPQYGRYFSVYTVDNGDTIETFREPEYEYFDRLWYKTPMEAGKACWVDPFYEHTEGTINLNEAIASYAKPLRRKDGTIVGIISTDLSFSRLGDAINVSEKSYPNAYFMLIGGDGRYFIHPDSTRLFRKTIFTDADPAKHAPLIALGHEMTAGKQGSMHIHENGLTYHVCYAPVPGTNWNLALLCPDSEILKNYHRLTYIIIALIVIGLLVIMWLCDRSVSQAIRPLKRLLRQSKKITAGHYDEVIPLSERKDDIGQLQNSFATMQQSLRDHVDSIKKTTEETKRRNEEMMRAMELAEKSVNQKNEFIRNVSHQIRTPLNIIMGFSQVLRDSLASQSATDKGQGELHEDNLNEIISMMRHNAIHLKRMVLMLFDSSETGTTVEMLSRRNVETSCNKVAHECIDFIQANFPDKSIRFETELPDNYCIQTNPLYLARGIRELLYNSAKYSDGKQITLRILQTETTIQFIIEDVGPGLPKESLDTIYEPFTKIDDISEGLGLGLPLTKRHAKSLGGDLTHDTTYQEGCRFIFEIPKKQ